MEMREAHTGCRTISKSASNSTGGTVGTAERCAEQFEGSLISRLVKSSQELPAATRGAVTLQQHKQLAAIRVPCPAVQQAARGALCLTP